MVKPQIGHIAIAAILLFSFRVPSLFFGEKTERPEAVLEQPALPPAEVQAVVSGSLPQVDAGYCQLGQSTVTFTNLGMSGGGGTLLLTDLAPGIALGDGFLLSENGFEITGIRIAGVDLSSIGALNPLGGNAQFATDPDGPGGLTDGDGDGFFDDLELGNSFEVTAFYRFDCGQATAITDNCQNNFSTSLSARLAYSESGAPQLFELTDYLKPLNRTMSSGSSATPDAFLGQDTFYVTHRLVRNIRFFDYDCNGDGRLRARLALPPGVSPLIAATVFLKNQTDTVPLLSAQASPDSLVLTYDASFTNFLSGDYELQLAFTAGCQAALGPSGFPFSLEHFCPSCDCGHRWYCGELPGPHLHAAAPPCPAAALLSCDKGVQAWAFEVNRTTFGFADEAFNSPFSPQAANKKVALGCDSVEMHLLSTVGSTAISDSVGIVVNYTNPINSNQSPAETFLFDHGTVRITHLGSAFNCALTPADLMVEDDAGEKTLTFDLNSCIAGLGFALNAGDTIEFWGQFSVNPDGPFGTAFTQVPDLRGSAFAQIGGERFSCDSFGDVFQVGKSRAVYDFPNSAAGLPQGCEDGELHFRLFVPDNDFSDFFGDEFRAAAKIDSFRLDFDPQLLNVYDNVEVMVSIPGHPVFGDSYFPIQPLSDFPSGVYLARFDTLDHAPTLNLVEEYSFDLMLRLTPTCASAAGGDFSLLSRIFYQDKFYAASIGDGSCVLPKTEVGSTSLVYSQPPQLTLTAISPPADTVQGGTAEWVVQLCNTSPSANAAVVWLAVENAGGGLTVTGLTDVTDPGSPVPILPIPYPDGTFGFGPSLPSGACADLLVEASADECENYEFNLLSGWNCGPFSQPNWNPAVNAPCAEISLSLSLVNQLDAPLSLDFQQVVSQCEGGGGELVSVAGQLVSSADLPADEFTLTFIFDENGDGAAQLTEPVLAEQEVSGAVMPGSPLPFGQTFLAQPEQACQVLVAVTAAATELCENILVEMPLPQMLNAGADQFLCDLGGTSFTTLLGSPDCGDSGYAYSWTALPPANADDISDAALAQPTLTVGWAGFLGQTLRYVLETERLACGQSTFDTIEINLPQAPFGFFETDSITLQAADCQSLVELCLPVTAGQLPTFQVTDNGLPYPPSAFVPCDDSLHAVQLATGGHGLAATDLLTGCSDTVFVTVRCATTETVVLDIPLHESDTVCFSNDEIFGAIETLENFCEDGSFISYEVFEDSCLILTANWVGSENACVLACDNVGYCDTTFLQVNVLHPIPNGVKDSIVIEQTAEFCFDENLLNIGGPIALVENICEDQSGTSVDFFIDETTHCINYFGVNLGVDTACVRLCDAAGNCDTIGVCVTVIPGDVVFDTVFISVDTNVFCLSDTLLPGNLTLVEDICPGDNGDEVQFSIDGTCISYWGSAVGQDTACIRFEDEFGGVGLINLIVTVVRTVPATVCDTVFVGESVTLCLDTLELPGAFTFIEEICPDVRTGNTDVFIDPVTLCVDYEGVMEGMDSVCIVVCDHFGFCDSTFLCLTVAPYFDPPTLGNDTSFTQKGTPVVIDFLANDTLFGGITDIYILEPPISGTVELNLQNSFTYIPDEPFCARWDNFTYVACNPNGCDTATVSVFIECIELTVFSAVSPNNDGVNDFFYIAKIEDFPDNQLWVYNRWGNIVFEKNEYENNWPGSWGEDIDLPDGTYYYVLEWSDGGTVTVQRGYFEMFR